MFKNVLLPLDGSHFSESALHFATRLAKSAGATLRVVRVHVTTEAQANAPARWAVDDQIHQQEAEYVQAVVERIRATGAQAEGILLEGPVVPSLDRCIEEIGIDLVIMTTHGRSGLTRAVLGSVAERCVRTTHVPVILLNPRTTAEGTAAPVAAGKRILVALDGSPESEEVLAPVIDLALLTGAHVTLVRIATAPFDIAATLGPDALREYMQRACNQARGYLKEVVDRLPPGVTTEVLTLEADRPASGILRACGEAHADLIAMATSGRSGWARIAIGSVAESVLHKANVPVLMMRPTAFTGREREAAAHFATVRY